MTLDDLRALALSSQLALRAERKSPQTLKTYGDGLRLFLDWCTSNGADPLLKSSLNQWIAELLEGGAAASTARSRQLAVRRFSTWLTEEGEIGADPFLGVKSPKLDEKVIEPLTDDELRRLIKACQPLAGLNEWKNFVSKLVARVDAVLATMVETSCGSRPWAP